ncbi:MAG: universal stress protein [Flavobacteriales bacterium]|nr:universal stress protein [Flavobacteriales bacterium]
MFPRIHDIASMDQPFRRILHPTDLSEASHTAFLHALKIALAVKGKLTLLHVTREGEQVSWDEFPGVRGTLHHWGLLPEHAPSEAVAGIGLAVRKLIAKDTDPVAACLALLDEHPADLIVLATSQHQGRMRWLGREVSGPLTREAGIPALLVPQQTLGFVDGATGDLALKSVLFPVAAEPRPTAALEVATTLLELLGFEGTTALLHVGDRSSMPGLEPPTSNGMTWERRVVDGDVVPTILAEAAAMPCDLIVMPTEGQHGFLDALRGSTTERVLREAKCPVLALPVRQEREER